MNEQELNKFCIRVSQIADELSEYSEGLIILIAPSQENGYQNMINHGLIAAMRGSTFVRRGLIEKAANECLDVVAGPRASGVDIDTEQPSIMPDEEYEINEDED